MLKKLVIFSSFIFNFVSFFILTTIPVKADTYYFNDEFSGSSLDASKWQAFNNAGTITLGDDTLWLKSGHNTTFPFIYSKTNPFPTSGDFSVEFKIQYTEATFWGTGAAISTVAPTNGQPEPNPLLKIWIWQDTTTGSPGFSLNFKDPDKSASQLIYTKPPGDLNPHIVRMDYTGNKYTVFLDNNIIYTSDPTTIRPSVFWFGNPFNTEVIPNWNWTSFKLDYLRVQQINTKTPLVFIPGIVGSELKVADDTFWSQPDGHGGIFQHAYPKDEKIWVNSNQAALPGNDDYFDILKMAPDGVTSKANIALTGNLFGGPTDFFVQNGYTLNQNLFIFPYDWRMDNTKSTDLLTQKIQQIKSQTGSSKVDIVAHSMGGLIARSYISDPSKASNVRKLVLLGTPHLGSPEFLKSLKYGTCLKYPVGQLCLTLAQAEVKDILQNMISGFELSPDLAYFNFYTGEDSQHPYPYRDNGKALNYPQIKSLLTSLNLNTQLFSQSEIFHIIDGSLNNTNGVDVTLIAGSGISTLGQITEQKNTNFLGISSTHKDTLDINGDGTVPLFSASLNDPAKGRSLLGSAKLFYTKQKHGDLITEGPALNLVKNILTDNNQIPADVSTQPYSFAGTSLSVHSPVDINIYDSFGNHTGPTANGDFETNIPGSSYDTLDDAKFIFLPQVGQYAIKLNGTGNGTFDFEIKKFNADVNTQTTLYEDVPVNTLTAAQTSINTNYSESPTLQVDSDGDGIANSFIEPTAVLTGDQTSDQIAPKTTIQFSGTSGNNGWYKSDVLVTLSANDEDGGSGIQKTEYSLDGGQNIQNYSGPFTISSEGSTKIKFRSIDNAGNEEYPQQSELKIDKTPPHILIDATPKTLWPPNGQLINVKIAGSSTDINLSSTIFTVEDEYHLVQPVINNFGQTIQLQASRNGDDQDGRNYILKASSEDLAGNIGLAITSVVVPHDQKNK